MSRIPTRELGRYLLQGQICQRGCVASSVSKSRAKQLGRHNLLPHGRCQSTQARQAHTVTTTVTATHLAPSVPLRKKLKDEAKQLKKDAKQEKRKGSNQTVDGWELTVGIEIHAQLNTARKLFSPAATSFNDAPNSHVALFDLSMPGSQPLLQKETLIPALRAALALNCDIQPISRFDRKHYFWWDQPSGYQITQYYEPFARNGQIMLFARDGIAPEDGESVTIGIQQVQMEQDTAKTLAQPGDTHWLDFNRVGVPLIEIITKPELHHPRTAAVLVRKMQTLLNAVDACVSGMETGGLRADVNVSVRRTSDASAPLGTRTEIKNLSTIKAVEDAIIAERDRQIQELEAGGTIAGETRGWTLGTKQTRRLRGKEGEVDYRYMPDPDLGPLIIADDLVDHIRKSVAYLPDHELSELADVYGLTAKDALSLLSLDNGGRIEYFYNVVESFGARLQQGTEGGLDVRVYAPLAANWILHEFGRLVDDVSDNESKPLEQKKITGKVAKELLTALHQGKLADTENMTAAIDVHDLWFHELSTEEYQELAALAVEGEDKVLREFREKKVYPQGKLMYLVGKMLRLGATERIDPSNAEKFMRAKVEELL
ncbi:hypothetical protein HYQ45_006616 [Verticillium longisporum]|uniref:Glutamyl-tRNA(Gln) amidotransferase subunit B, mitochondrial n=1 Tax=Verticillium longisporum TaxID=100787 RepID=A0A8I2ZR52_VERLO|nr:hypothetical protein HYQ45_006616 [Verticillium longisporum]